MFHKRMRLPKEERGFTLMETMVVLTIIIVLLSIAVLPFPKLAAHFEKEQFLNQLQADLFFAQSYAIARQEKVEVKFFYTENCYTIRSLTSTANFLVQRNMPDTIRYMDGSLTILSFLPNGNTNNFGTVRFRYGSRYISLVFQIGKGRFYVTEQ
ncbi:competence type IV pilus minor pilin ComGD [Bacillus sp. FJAT-27231]|uniref:competence type IV pilus minor pilin ComGD n=1 Tax=Bacillus sp. FJAT-27231 TaxID=1679168 RepID=UPI000670C2AE|nr:competence type IV pilus minor pilin ComGD [Bacillus sp. FJAT-27231]